MHNIRRILWLATSSILLVNCSASLTVGPWLLRDLSAPAAAKVQVSSIIVLPPRGSERGETSDLADLERVLLSKGFRVISSGITGRLASGPVEVRADEVSRLSDLERALILARKSNADVLLQVGEIAFTPSERYFTLFESDPHHLTEVFDPPSGPYNSYRIRIKEARFTFQAKVISVEDGEILLSMDISQTTSRVAPRLTWTFLGSRDETIISIDTPQRRRAALKQVMEAFSNHMSPTAPQRVRLR